MAARRRSSRRKSRKKLQPRWLLAASASLLFLLIIVGLFRESGCRRGSQTARKPGAEKGRPRGTAPPPNQSVAVLAPAERQGIARRLKQAADGAGGAGVWVKDLSRFSSAPPITEPDSAKVPEILAIPARFDSVLSGIKRAAHAQSLVTDIKVEHSPGGLRLAEIQVTKGNQTAGKWRLREVPRLFRAAIVIDDLGQNRKTTDQLLEVPYPITFSILPHLQYSRETAQEAHRAGHEVMLHLPMEAEAGASAIQADGIIKVGMPERQVEQLLKADLASVAYVRGVNNHQGSRATTDPRLMLAVMRTLAQHHLFFVDSRTTVDTVAFDEARRAGVPTFFRSVFLDDKADVSYTLGQLEQLRRVVKQRGAALAIGHPHPSTIIALRRYLPQFERDDIQLVPASELVRLPEVARLTPPRRMAQTSGGSK